MTLLPIAKLGNPMLRQIAAPVHPDDIASPAFQQFIDDMFYTMVETHGIGLAAPQVSRSQQIIVMECSGEEGFPRTVLINPEIVFYGPRQEESWEGCLSVDGLRGKVTRPSMVRARGLDRHGQQLDIEATGLYAVCIQHEIDHLIGKLFLDRMTDMSTLTQLDEFERFWKEDHAAVI
ncbi:MAG: peptide deformylase [Nitrospirae bacterium RIFCSPLOWO2_01_FULL_62_17]|nr:MAG: peptide deformylase [Nitrospirae bacterium RIFCSPLOWO2_01_FULL_62_17]